MIRQISINGYDHNFSYFVVDQETRQAFVVDPGDVPHLLSVIEVEDLIIKGLIITHSHFDHVSGVKEMVERFGVPVYVHKNARGKLEAVDEQMVYLEDGDKLHIGKIQLKVIYTPGHSDDSVCYLIEAENNDSGKSELLTGDTVFVEGCGRADLVNSNVADLYTSLQKLKELPADTLVYPGHDYGSKRVSTIAWEKQHNKYFMADSFDVFKTLRMR